MCGAAQAVPFSSSSTVSNFCQSSDPCLLTFHLNVAVNANAISAGTLTLTVLGDFDGTSENLTASIEGLSLGVLLDNNTLNGQLTATDSGSQYGSAGGNPAPTTGTINIALVDLSAIVADGVMDITFTTSANVNDLNVSQNFADPEEFITASIAYDVRAAQNVPEPGTLALLGLGTLLLGRVRSRRVLRD